MPEIPRRVSEAWRRVRRAVLSRRRPLAALLTFVAVAVGLHVARPPAPATVPMTVAARDLAAGTVLSPSDVRQVAASPDDVPAGATTDPSGETLAGPVRRGEPLTDARLLGPGVTQGHPELTALPVRLPDAGMVALLHVGDRIDVIAADPQGDAATTVARDALVLGLPGDGSHAASDQQGAGVATAAGLSGRLVVLGVAESEVTSTTAAAARDFLSFDWSR